MSSLFSNCQNICDERIIRMLEGNWDKRDSHSFGVSYEFRSEHRAKSDILSTAGSYSSQVSFALGIAMRQVSLITTVSEKMLGVRSVRRPTGAAGPLSEMMRLLPEENPVRILDVKSADLRHRIKKLSSEAGPERCLLLDLRSSADELLDRLANALLSTDGMDNILAEHYSNAVGTAIAVRALSRIDNRKSNQSARSCGKLPQWRLKRVREYIDAHLDQPLTLASIAALTGLTRMHFAAQFRAATGVRPHEYLLRRRIEFAQRLLSESSMPIVEIALSVGFQTQAHFTTVFKRFVEDTPYQWRRSRSGKIALTQDWRKNGHVPEGRFETVTLRSDAAASTN
jgi:AraC-like DNA-binding protein